MKDETDKILYKPHLLNIKIYEPGKPIEEVRRELGLEKIIKLASNENAYGPSPLAVEEMKRCADDVNRYPDGKCSLLREKLSEKLGVEGENLIFTNGSNELAELFARAFIRKGDKAVLPHPTFSVYYNSVIAEEGKIVKVPLIDNLQFDFAGILNALDENTKVVFISNPNNPTGCYLNRDDLNELLKNIPEKTIVFLDEAYFEFADAEDMPEGIQAVKDGHNVIVARTFSKAYGLAGLRIGYGIARKDIIEGLERVRQPFNVNLMAQCAAVRAIDDQEHLQKSVNNIRKEKKRITEALQKIGVKVYPSQANFILVKAGIPGKELFQLLLKKGVIVRYLGEPLEDFVRVTIGREEENTILIEKMRELMEETRKP